MIDKRWEIIHWNIEGCLVSFESKINGYKAVLNCFECNGIYKWYLGYYLPEGTIAGVF